MIVLGFSDRERGLELMTELARTVPKQSVARPETWGELIRWLGDRPAMVVLDEGFLGGLQSFDLKQVMPLTVIGCGRFEGSGLVLLEVDLTVDLKGLPCSELDFLAVIDGRSKSSGGLSKTADMIGRMLR